MNQNKDGWECPKCKISIEPQFDSCWKCGFLNRLEEKNTSKKDDVIKIEKLSNRYQSLRLFQTLIWAWFGFCSILLIPGLLLGVMNSKDYLGLSVEAIFLILALSGISLIILYYCTKMFSKMINFLFDLDEKNNEYKIKK